ncbi:MAG: glycosyltransferase family 2 protein [Candidatus Tectimicrobiota bacterium]
MSAPLLTPQARPVREGQELQTLPDVSVVIPCLNERATIAEAVATARTAFARWPGGATVIVADNGSTDGSPDLARAAGARVVPAMERGYGAALQAGFAAAETTYVVYADADLTYDFHEGPQLVATLHEAQADMVVGSRLRGHIEPGAMPPLHRYLGTPTLTAIINLLFGHRQGLSDCNSGFRALRRERLAAWQATSPGMEFASELLVNALCARATILEVPITLRRDRGNRQPHLQTWRDGMRHFLMILARAPWLFLRSGLAIVGFSALLAALCALGPQWVLGKFALFDYHTLIFALLLGFVGAQLFGTGLLLHLRRPQPMDALASRLLRLHEGVLFWLLVSLGSGVGTGLGFVIWSWIQHGFANIAYLKFTLFLLYGATVLGSLGMNLFYAHLLKRA